MKKLIPLVIVALGLLIWLLVGVGPSAETPAVASVLPSASTVGTAGIQRIDGLASTLLAAFEKVPARPRAAGAAEALLAARNIQPAANPSDGERVR